MKYFTFLQMSENEKVKLIYTSITFVCGVKPYVCMYFVYVFIDLISANLCCVKYD